MLVALAGLALLWQLRPSAPALPRSLSAPLTVETIESVGLAPLVLPRVARARPPARAAAGTGRIDQLAAE